MMKNFASFVTEARKRRSKRKKNRRLKRSGSFVYYPWGAGLWPGFAGYPDAGGGTSSGDGAGGGDGGGGQ